ncbi:MAG: DUF664 domain-containing protein [Ilumatobacteraceae bacterium]
MATTNEVLLDAFGRIDEGVRGLLSSVPADHLNVRPGGVGNPIGWLVWHLLRVQDDHLSEIAEREQVWIAGGWYERLALPFPPAAHGYGFTSEQVDQTRFDGTDLLAGYQAGVQAMTVELLGGITSSRLDEIIDRRWDPPVTVAVRIVSVAEDCFQHLGQANYVAGLL